ncbi:helix-turn-helix domain-containing protein [Neobacillus mesonae]|uniref:helix-turn-helix domain-containing protein n=1 Tax=Neobacillus mesonae TaxID=1193713 RepID=UPI00257279A9|nr:helix-turn-helix transcriptional regulator [Neobacillus mesonae]MED4204598.1 helix-turn-helix transcriptional regulator [Neobacillus mesonae]
MDGSKLKQLRGEKGFSLTKLSELTGISKSYLSLIERDIQTNPSLDIVEKVSRAFEVEVDYFINNTEPLRKKRTSVKSTLKVEIELSEDQLSPQKLKQIQQLINVINTE